MAAGYQLTIKNADETIELSTKEQNGSAEIQTVVFKMNTLDDNTRNRADAVRGEITITGPITKENKEKTKRLAKWAMDANKKTLYRNVVIVVYDGENCSGDVLRRYEVDNMFVIDYEENFGTSADEGKYTLFMAQKEGNEKKEVFSS